MNLGISAVHTSDEIRSFSIPSTIFGRMTYGSNWIYPGNLIGKVTESKMSKTRSTQNHSSKTDFENMRGNQYFERQNISMSQTPLDRTTSPIDSIHVGGGIQDLMPQTRQIDSPTLPTDSSEQNGKAHVPADLNPDQSSSDSS